MNRKHITLLVVIVVGILLVSSIVAMTSKDKDDFSVDTYFLKFVMKEGENTTHSLNIDSHINGEYSIQVHDIEGLYTLSEDYFYMAEGEEKSIDLFFESDNEPGVYVGHMSIMAGKEEVEIPIVLELQSRDVFFAVNLDQSYSSQEVRPGDQLSSTIRIYNLRDTTNRDVLMSYSIKDLRSNIILTEIEDTVVGTDTTFTKSFSLPEDLEEGYYVLAIGAETYDSYGTASYLFSVEDSFNPIFEGSDFFTYVFAVSIILFLFGIMMLVFHTLKDRNRLIHELDKMQKKQIHTFIEKFEEREKKYLAKTKSKKSKVKVKKKYEEIKKKEVKKIKAKQKKQHKQLEKLNSNKDMEKKLKGWKKQGFKVPLIKKTKNKQTKVSKYKKQGYKV
jgi:hypothetical protein